MKKPPIRKFAWISAAIVVLLLVILLVFDFDNSSQGGPGGFLYLGMLLFGLLIGAVIAFLIGRRMQSKPPQVVESSHTVIQSIRKVFKVVSAEGQFSEIYNYEETSKLLNFIPSKKKALVLVEAKIMVGFDFEKLRWQIDEEQKKITLLHFPEPEILSTEMDYKYYNIEEQLFNLFSKEDLTKIQSRAKEQVVASAKKSSLLVAAKEQMYLLLEEMVQAKNYHLENSHLILENKGAPQIESASRDEV